MNFSLSSLGDVNGILPAGGGLADIIGLVTAVISLLLAVAIIAAVIFIIIGGIKWVTSSGDKQGLANARATVTYAIIGLVLAFLSFAILRFVGHFFGINLGTNNTGSTGALHQIPGFDL